ncbi:MAG: hypothetical protein IPJ65_40555 [Archangiaceae bacterium]|nr:hypothetical protein [Archangiaceae bacterium]
MHAAVEPPPKGEPHVANVGFVLGDAPSADTRGVFTSTRYLSRAPVEIPGPPPKNKATAPTPREGTLVGADGQGRAVVRLTEGDKLVHLAFSDVSPRLAEGQTVEALRSAAVHLDPLRGIDPARRTPLDPRISEALHLRLQQPVLEHPQHGTVTHQDYVDALCAIGEEAFCFGGAGGRDALQLLAEKPDATAAELAATFNDLDIQTTASPEQVRQICVRLGGKFKDFGLWTEAHTSKRFGIFGVGEHKKGLDLVIMKGGHDERGSSVFTRELAIDAEDPDFQMNNLRIRITGKREDWEQIDPSGLGIADAIAKRLTVVGDRAETDKALGFRAIKFLARGCTMPDETRRQLEANIEHFWPKLKADLDGAPWVSALFRNLKSDSLADLDHELDGHHQAMQKVGWGALHDAYFVPLKGQIFDEFIRRQVRKIDVDQPLELFDRASALVESARGTSFEPFIERYRGKLGHALVDEVVARSLAEAKPADVDAYLAEVQRLEREFEERGMTFAVARLPEAAGGNPMKDFSRRYFEGLKLDGADQKNQFDAELKRFRGRLEAGGLGAAVPAFDSMRGALWGGFRQRDLEAKRALGAS